jgi:GxxExxY protein
VLIYLSGSIEFSGDFGRGWRAEITPFLLGLGYRVYDPAADEQKNLRDEEVAHFREWKTADPERFAETIRKIIHWDLDIVEQQAGAVICFWDEHAGKGAGTQAEVTAAFRRGIPVYLVTSLPREKISGWVLGCVTGVFASFEQLKGFLEHGLAPKERQKSLEHGNTRKDTERLLYWDVSGSILEAAVNVHKTLGRGFLEKVYVRAVAHELHKQGLRFELEKRLKVVYDHEVVGEYVADMDVEEKVLVEFKACESLRIEHEAQLLNYLKTTGRKVGLLLNFGRGKLESLRRVL